MSESDALAGLGNLTNTLLAHQLHHEDVASLLADRHPELEGDSRRPGIDHFVRTDLDSDDARHQHLMASLRRIADRFHIQSAAAGTEVATSVATTPAGTAQASQFAVTPVSGGSAPFASVNGHAVSAPAAVDTSGDGGTAAGRSDS
jgi:hypothetical protein